jgi:hypothetical protein
MKNGWRKLPIASLNMIDGLTRRKVGRQITPRAATLDDIQDGIMNAAAFGFRQWHGGGRYVPASFPPSLRLHFTFPPAEPLTEARQRLTQLLGMLG